MAFLPITREDMNRLDWHYCDIVLVTGDAYVDHPSFGTAIISRVLEHEGFRVCILSQPQSQEDLRIFGRPRLAFFVNGGNIDPMVAHYTVAKKRRSRDAYTPGGVMGKRPDRATATYCRWIRGVFPDVPIAIGGLEASLRRFSHYDYWENRVKPSILIESGADLLMFGMGEKSSVEIARRLSRGQAVSDLVDIRGTCYCSDVLPQNAMVCPSFEDVNQATQESKILYAKACRIQQDEHDAVRGHVLAQRHGDTFVIQNEPALPLTTEEMDQVYDLPYERTYHPSYEALSGVPAIEEVKFSIAHNRGCFGACNFCAIAYHQGRMISARSKESVLKEAALLASLPDFKGYIHDVGGPTANFRAPSCDLQARNGLCKGKKCLAPRPCKHLKVDHSEYLSILRDMRKIPGVKRVFIRSGIRFDYLLADPDDAFFKDLVTHHVSGQLKVAPEHCSDRVLSYMGKPDFSVYRRFYHRFMELTKSIGKKQYLVPYLMSSHPGSSLHDAVKLAQFLKGEGLHPEQVQDFYPTPGTVSTCMFYTELDPYTMEKVYVAHRNEEKAAQRALLQYYRKEHFPLIRETLRKIGRTDLIGFGKECLVPPERGAVTIEKKPAKRKTSLSKHLNKKKKKDRA